MVHHFTHWVERVPLRNIKARTRAHAFFVQWVFQFTAPSRLLSDRGDQFRSALLNRLCSRLGISNIYTTAYHPQTNAQDKRLNRFIWAHLSLYTQPNQKDWDCHIPACLMGYRTAIHDVTRFSPFFLIFGRRRRIPFEILLTRPAKLHEED